LYVSFSTLTDLHRDQVTFAPPDTPITSAISASSPFEDQQQLIFDMEVDDDDFLTMLTPGPCKYTLVVIQTRPLNVLLALKTQLLIMLILLFESQNTYVCIDILFLGIAV
jgi:hypothetical protein